LKTSPRTLSAGASNAKIIASDTSRTSTSGRHIQPPPCSESRPLSSASFTNVLTTRSNRMRGLQPYTVPLRSETGTRPSSTISSSFSSP
jgi:hypothetical protein